MCSLTSQPKNLKKYSKADESVHLFHQIYVSSRSETAPDACYGGPQYCDHAGKTILSVNCGVSISSVSEMQGCKILLRYHKIRVELRTVNTGGRLWLVNKGGGGVREIKKLINFGQFSSHDKI